MDESGVELRGPEERFARTLESFGERSKDLGSVSEKSPVEINHNKEKLESRFIQGRRKLSDGGGMLGERTEPGTGEKMAQELGLGDGKLKFSQANHQAMGRSQLQDILEVLNMSI